jgi:hypothetical protein
MKETLLKQIEIYFSTKNDWIPEDEIIRQVLPGYLLNKDNVHLMFGLFQQLVESNWLECDVEGKFIHYKRKL